MLNFFPPLDGEIRNENYRSPAGVALKLANLRYIDTGGERGMKAASKLDALVHAEFIGDRERLEKTAGTIRAWIHSQKEIALESTESELEEASEGRLLTRVHRSRERNRKIVERKKAQVLEAKGNLACEACGFDFSAVYGPRGEGFIECHHTRPVRDLTPGSKTKLSELALLCSNCHRMIHARAPWLSMDELRGLISATN
ncbi:HNH endonuclease [Salinicola sp. CR57]|uniref:HNH endonuclease n=1 Tax=Salinicola sp. CR57 TaxID=1949086 RepID=UPI001E61AA86|nr:HNH endonuclease [Salinicola sp. CR57]